MPDFVEVVFVELAHKTGKVTVLEVLGQDVLREFFVLQTVWLAKPGRWRLSVCAPRERQSCRLHCPIVLRSRPADSPTSYHEPIR